MSSPIPVEEAKPVKAPFTHILTYLDQHKKGGYIALLIFSFFLFIACALNISVSTKEKKDESGKDLESDGDKGGRHSATAFSGIFLTFSMILIAFSIINLLCLYPVGAHGLCKMIGYKK